MIPDEIHIEIDKRFDITSANINIYVAIGAEKPLIYAYGSFHFDDDNGKNGYWVSEGVMELLELKSPYPKDSYKDMWIKLESQITQMIDNNEPMSDYYPNPVPNLDAIRARVKSNVKEIIRQIGFSGETDVKREDEQMD